MRKRGAPDIAPDVVTSSGRVRKRYVHQTRFGVLREQVNDVSLRTVGGMLSLLLVVPVIPLLVRDPQTRLSPHEFMAGESLLSGELRIIDVSFDDAEELAGPLRDSGLAVVTYSPDVLQSIEAEPKASTWWITSRVAADIDLDVFDRLRARGDRVLLDGDTPLARSVLQLAAPPNRHPSLPGAARSAVMRGVHITWNGTVRPLVPKVKGQTLAETDRGTPALFLTDDSSVMWSPMTLTGPDDLKSLPFLGQELAVRWNIAPRAERVGFDLFVEVDNEDGAIKDFPIDQWAESGVTRIFVPAWKYDEETGDQYNYKSLVRNAHRRNIEVWAWMEWPHVAFKFWEVHPECRERSADGRAAKVGWREHVALTDAKCFDLAWNSTKKVLRSFAFDGTMVADLNFESVFSGHRDAATYTPFHPTVRREFSAKFGWDPKTLVSTEATAGTVDPKLLRRWQAFREEKLFGIYSKLLPRLAELKGRKVAVTVIDDRTKTDGSTLMRENSGQSTRAILKLQSTYDFEVIVRDPLPFRVVRPADVMAGFRGLKGQQNQVSIGISGLARINTKGLATARPVGLEFASAVSDAGRLGARVSLFGTDAARSDDLAWVKFAMASEAKISESRGVVYAQSAHGFTLRLTKRARHILIDGSRVGTGNKVYVPSGEHQVTVSP